MSYIYDFIYFAEAFFVMIPEQNLENNTEWPPTATIWTFSCLTNHPSLQFHWSGALASYMDICTSIRPWFYPVVSSYPLLGGSLCSKIYAATLPLIQRGFCQKKHFICLNKFWALLFLMPLCLSIASTDKASNFSASTNLTMHSLKQQINVLEWSEYWKIWWMKCKRIMREDLEENGV